MGKRVTNQDLLERVIRLETEFSSIRSGVKWLLGLVSTATAGILVQFIRTVIMHGQ